MTEKKEHYLGDGLYASFDGFQIKLRAPREFGDHEVYLEAEAFKELLMFASGKWPSNLFKDSKHEE